MNPYLNITSNTKIYILVPANVATGGPELLHQLGFHLRNECSLNAFMYYLPDNIDSPVHNNYLKYNIPNVGSIEDRAENIIISSELYNHILFSNQYHSIQKCVWWLSVDFFYGSKFEMNQPFKNFFFRGFNFLSKKSNLFAPIDVPNYVLQLNKNSSLENEKILKNTILHLVQSQYAFEHLKAFNINNIAFLSDYLNDSFLETNTDISMKENIIAYNPSKGAAFTKKLIAASPQYKFIPIQNMTPEGVINLLQKSKIYIDFGNHPGKDRIPREAAILGCCIITGTRGSASFYNDVMIPNEFKFNDSENSLPLIIEKISYVFHHYNTELSKFIPYVEKIKDEKSIFINECKKIFSYE